MAIPLALVLSDVPRVMRFLYDKHLTASDPATAAEVLEFDPSGWVEHGQAALRRRRANGE